MDGTSDIDFRTPGFAPIRQARQPLASVCVFCGARSGHDMMQLELAAQLGRAIALSGIRLVYGGGTDGLMGAVALAAASHGGRVVAVVPQFMAGQITAIEAEHELVTVADMHARKARMYGLADGFVALPGGIGTLEELAEILTWQKLGRHAKPVLVANFAGFWRPLLGLLRHMETAGFLDGGLVRQLLVADSPATVLPMLQRAAYFPDGSEGAFQMSLPLQ